MRKMTSTVLHRSPQNANSVALVLFFGRDQILLATIITVITEYLTNIYKRQGSCKSYSTAVRSIDRGALPSLPFSHRLFPKADTVINFVFAFFQFCLVADADSELADELVLSGCGGSGGRSTSMIVRWRTPSAAVESGMIST